jgi:hypothetical protein
MPSIVLYQGTCDASAAVRIGSSSRFVAASDEDHILRIYNQEAPGAPENTVDLEAFLKPAEPGKEPDIEGAAAIGDRIYWVTSHGRNKDREEQESRQRFFATSVTLNGGEVCIEPCGRPYKRLIRDLLGTPELNQFNLARAVTLAPEETGGLNLEGLAPTPEGYVLLGFRNPVPDGRALIVALKNPDELVENGAASANLSVAGRLALGGRGIRAIEFVPESRSYLIVAGAFDDAHEFKLYKWSGRRGDEGTPIDVEIGDCKPEELIVTRVQSGSHELELLSDDGDREVDGRKCKKTKPQNRGFRGLRMTIDL